MERISVSTIILESWHLTRASWKFFLYGALLGLPSAVIIALLETQPTLSEAELATLVTNHLGYCISFFLVYLCSLFIGKSHLILSFQEYTKKNFREHSLFPHLLLTPFMKALRIDLAFFFFALIILVLLALPALAATLMENNAVPALLLLGKLTLLPIIAIGYFIREFTYFYFLLSPLTFRGSLEAGSNLFFRQKSACLSFGLAFLLLILLFTFSFNFVMLSIVALLKQMPLLPTTIGFFLAALIILGWYEVWRQALWFRFFQAIARPKDPAPDEAVPVALEKKVPEISGV